MNLNTLIDEILELTVVASFSRIGPAVRSRLFDWEAPADVHLPARPS